MFFLTDTEHERNALMEIAYPKLDTFCKSLGFDFQVVDMRWGVREDATDDHTTTELCLKELHACQKVSTGPYFVVITAYDSDLEFESSLDLLTVFC